MTASVLRSDHAMRFAHRPEALSAPPTPDHWTLLAAVVVASFLAILVTGVEAHRWLRANGLSRRA